MRNVSMSSPPSAQLRTGRGDPYAAASRFGTVADGFCSNGPRWLWVPACAGTTRCVVRSLPIQISNSQDRHCERSEAIHSQGKSNDGLLRRFAPRNDVECRHDSAFSRRDAPEPCMNHSPRHARAWGMPGARCTHSLACKMGSEHTSVVTTGPPESPGIPARNGFNGLFRALPGDRAFLSPSSTDMACLHPVGPTCLR
jgi:hypothetical protein